MKIHLFAMLCAICTLAWPAAAQEPEAAPAKPLSPYAAVKLGGTLHSVFTQLDPWAALELEGGVTLLAGRLDVGLSLGWARPPASHDAADPRFEGGDYAWELSQDFLMISLLGRWRFLDPAGPFNAYAGAGPRVFLMRTVINGDSGSEATGENTQTETRFGGVLLAGAEYRLGPGSVLFEAGVGLGKLDGLITGDVSSSDLFFLLGYRLSF